MAELEAPEAGGPRFDPRQEHRRTVGVSEGIRELGEDLGQAVAIPRRSRAIHRGRHQNATGWKTCVESYKGSIFFSFSSLD